MDKIKMKKAYDRIELIFNTISGFRNEKIDFLAFKVNAYDGNWTDCYSIKTKQGLRYLHLTKIIQRQGDYGVLITYRINFIKDIDADNNIINEIYEINLNNINKTINLKSKIDGEQVFLSLLEIEDILKIPENNLKIKKENITLNKFIERF